MANAPIILYFDGPSPCIGPHLRSLREYSPKTPVIALVRDLYNLPADFAGEVAKIADHSEGADEFGSIFENHSPNPREFELIWIQRWFTIMDYVWKNGIETFWCSDWDTLFFTELADEHWEPTAPANTCFLSRDILTNWVKWLVSVYEDKATLGAFAALYQAKHPDFPSVGDMTLALWYAKYNGIPLLCDTVRIKDDGFFDANLSLTGPGCTVLYDDSGIPRKLIKFVGGQPFAALGMYPGDYLRMKSMHCWHPRDKQQMDNYLHITHISKGEPCSSCPA